MGVDQSLIPFLVDAIKDWRDPDEDRRISGVENEYYQPLGYTAKNGPIDDLQELLLIRYITPKMYWGNRANQLANTGLNASGPASTDEEGEGEIEEDYSIGLVDLFTPISIGYVNINTASNEVLQILFTNLQIRDKNSRVTAQEAEQLASASSGSRWRSARRFIKSHWRPRPASRSQPSKKPG